MTGSEGAATFLLERWARGAGATSWFRIDADAALRETQARLRPGSCVTAYLQKEWPIAGVLDPVLTRDATNIAEAARPGQEVLAMSGQRDSPKLLVEHLSSPSEFETWAEETRGRRVWLGPYPLPVVDSPQVRTAVLADPDGVVRAHPY